MSARHSFSWFLRPVSRKAQAIGLSNSCLSSRIAISPFRRSFQSTQAMQEQESYLIIGAGTFGASTALELRRVIPSATVTLLDQTPFPNPSAASHDLNKIIRADYTSLFYMKLALEAQELWRNDPIYKSYYHQSGMLYAENKGMACDFLKNYEKIGVKPDSEMLTPEEAKSRFGGAFRDANWEGVKENYWNPRSGWGEGEGALRSLIKAAIDHGTIYKAASVSKLSFSEDGICRGVRLKNGQELTANHIIVSTGAWTPMLLADSAPWRKEFQVESRMVAAGAIQCRAVFPSDQAEKLRIVPVLFNGMPHTEGL